MGNFRIKSEFQPKGDQPEAIQQAVENLKKGKKHQVILGVTGCGKTFTAANIIERLGKPTLVIAHNKTLAAQLYHELKQFFPSNAVEYFVSYYDYYQPEAYVPATDTYIAKESHINDEIDRLRHSATRAVLERTDTIIVASVSCIFATGDPNNYSSMMLSLKQGQNLPLEQLLDDLVSMQYERAGCDLLRGMFRVRGDTIEIFPSHEANRIVRISYFGDEIESLEEIDPLTGKVATVLEHVLVPPNSHYVTSPQRLQRAVKSIKEELKQRLKELREAGKELYAQRLEQRTNYDLEMLELRGHCPGIENYSRHLDGRKPGQTPWTLLDFFPDDFLCVVDESHVTLPQLRGMYLGDRSRKQTLVDFGFRLPSALDNRPLTFDEWLGRVSQVLYLSATPGDWEIKQSKNEVIEIVVRPTGLVDPPIFLHPASEQVEDLVGRINEEVKKGGRVLVGTLTKRMAEDLTDFLQEAGIKASYMHSDIDTLERLELISALRAGKFDVLVGVNLLREGLDIPEVTLVAVMDADKEGFLRSSTSLIQIAGRTARNVEGKVILYADKITDSIAQTVAETQRRRHKQLEYNRIHGITPKTISKPLVPMIRLATQLKRKQKHKVKLTQDEIEREIGRLKKEMHKAASKLEFERAAELRDLIQELTDLIVSG